MNQKPRPELILTAWTPPSDPSRTRLIQIGFGPSTSGPRLGGRPPAGVHHPAMQLDCRYFVTVPVCSDPALELSIFVNRDFATLIRSRGQLYRDDRVLLLTHGPSIRAADSPCTSALSEHPLVLGPEVDDSALGDDGELGGVTYPSGYFAAPTGPAQPGRSPLARTTSEEDMMMGMSHPTMDQPPHLGRTTSHSRLL